PSWRRWCASRASRPRSGPRSTRSCAWPRGPRRSSTWRTRSRCSSRACASCRPSTRRSWRGRSRSRRPPRLPRERDRSSSRAERNAARRRLVARNDCRRPCFARHASHFQSLFPRVTRRILPASQPSHVLRALRGRRPAVKDQVFRIEYYVTIADDRPGVGADLGRRLKDEGVNLLALSSFPLTAGRTQVDLVPEHPEQFVKAARKLNLVVGEPKIAFLIQGTDRPGP